MMSVRPNHVQSNFLQLGSFTASQRTNKNQEPVLSPDSGNNILRVTILRRANSISKRSIRRLLSTED
jgi:hypothetical protein